MQVDDEWVQPGGGSSEPARSDHRGLCPECADRLIADQARRLLE